MEAQIVNAESALATERDTANRMKEAAHAEILRLEAEMQRVRMTAEAALAHCEGLQAKALEERAALEVYSVQCVYFRVWCRASLGKSPW